MKLIPQIEVSDAMDQTRISVRWWPAVAIAVVAVVAWGYIWQFQDIPRQDKNIRTTLVALAAITLLLLWIVFASRLPWRLRGGMVAGVAVIVAFLALTTEITGVTGDLIPILRWRWQHDRRHVQADPIIANAESNQPVAVSARDFPQFMGPRRDGTVTAFELETDWVAHPPEELWRHAVGAAWSGFAVVAEYAVTLEQRGETEVVACYDLETGQLRWKHEDPARYSTTIAGEGPRTVPTIVDGRVYTMGATGILNCLELRDGSRHWSTDTYDDYEADPPGWGVSCSPLVAEGRVVVCVGGADRALVAYDAADGEIVWFAGDNGMQYSSPMLAQFDHSQQVIIFNRKVTGHDWQTGAVLWEYDWPGGHPHIMVPLHLSENRLFVSSGYGTGCEMLKIVAGETWQARSLWNSTRLKSKFANAIARDGAIYGLDDGILVCLDAQTGERRWKRGRMGHGQLLLCGTHLLVMAENGDVVLVEATSEKYHELTRFSALAGKTWNPPALAPPYLLVRNDQEAACFRLPGRID